MEWAVALGIAVVGLVAVAVIRHIDDPAGRWGRQLRARLLLGIPWGTLVSIGLVLFVYYIVQDGLANVYDPVVLPFQSWSYLYPTGWLTAGFAHSGFNHLLNNVTAALVLGSIAEYAFSHYPTERGAVSFGSRSMNPYVRAFIIVPVAILAIGLFTALFALGPVIGFSGVVFAMAGFALVRYPLTTVLGLFGIQLLRRVIEAIREPITSAGISAPAPSPPWWAEVAIQGHAIGFLVGVLLAVYVFRRRDTIPDAWRIFAGVLGFAIAQSLWAVYWYEGHDQYLLLRAIGIVLVVALAVLIAVAVAGRMRDIAGLIAERRLALGIMVIALAAMIGPAVAVNLVATDPGAAADRPALEVGDYRVIYAEGIDNEMVAVGGIDVGGLGNVSTSGVIVYSEPRTIWSRELTPQRLADQGFGWVTLGGVGWRTNVFVDREAWRVLGNGSVYQVWLQTTDQSVHAFASEARRADVRIANRTLSIGIEDERFQVSVAHQGATVGTATIPASNESVTIADLTLTNVEGELFARYDGTIVRVASRA